MLRWNRTIEGSKRRARGTERTGFLCPLATMELINEGAGFCFLQDREKRAPVKGEVVEKFRGEETGGGNLSKTDAELWSQGQKRNGEEYSMSMGHGECHFKGKLVSARRSPVKGKGGEKSHELVLGFGVRERLVLRWKTEE